MFHFFAVKTTLSMNGSFPNLRPVRSRSQAFGPGLVYVRCLTGRHRRSQAWLAWASTRYLAAYDE